MSSKRDHKRRIDSGIVQLLAAATLATVLVGCDSAVSESSKKAKTDSNLAARLASSAGETRPTQSFVDSLKDKDKAAQAALVQDVVRKINSDTANKAGVWKSYLEQRSVHEDLKRAAAMLNDAIKLSDVGVDMKAALQAQLGATAAQQAQVQLSDVDSQLNDLAEFAIDIQNEATFINGLGIEADVQDKRAQAMTPGDTGAPRGKLDEATAAANNAQKVVAGLEQQIADTNKDKQALYDQSDAAFQAAEKIKGTAAIELSKKAVNLRGQGDAKAEEVMNLQPTLAASKAALALAQIQQAQAQAQLTAATAGAEQGATVSKDASERAVALRQQAKALIDGPGGLAAKTKDFYTRMGKLRKDLDTASGFASTADKSYDNAAAQWSAYQRAILESKPTPDNPLLKIANSPEIGGMFKLRQAGAMEQVGRAQLAGYLTQTLATVVDDSMAAACKAAGIPAPAAPATAPAAKYADIAAGDFDKAASLADSPEIRRTSPDSPARWLALTVKSVALHGVYSATHNPEKLTAAQNAAQEARQLNPFLPIQSLATGAGSSAP